MSRVQGLSFEVSNRHVTWVLDQMAQRKWEETTFDIIDTYVTPGSTFIDIGAWIGVFTVYAARRRDAHVVSVEPDPAAYDALNTNVLNNGVSTLVDAYPAALWTHSEGMILHQHEELGSSMTGLTREGKPFHVPTITPAHLAAKYPAPSLLKIDVEGAEQDIFPDLFAAYPHIPIVADLHYPIIPRPHEEMIIPRQWKRMTDPGGGFIQVLIYPENGEEGEIQ